ncbi:DHHA2 domain-containing protein, partial [Neobacillus niacini]
DILTNDSVGLALGSKTNAVEKAYNVTLENNTAVLKGVVSRKKQIVPVLTDIFNQGI